MATLVRRKPEGTLDPGDHVFRGVLGSAGAMVLILTSAVGLFLSLRAAEALSVAGWSFLSTSDWEPDAHRFGIRAVMTGTLLIGFTAVILAFPLALGTALYISEYAPTRLRAWLISLIDLMAAVPSVVYGLWGFFLLQGQVAGVSRWIATYLGWIPLLQVDMRIFKPHDPLSSPSDFTSSTFIAGLVVALMITPITCSVMRESFSQAPVGEREGAYALGATRWGMIRSVVLPFGKGGIIGGTMLGFGRALGETVAVFMIISLTLAVQPNILQKGGSSISALIALRYGEASLFGTSALMAAGLALFLMTLAVNIAASAIVARSRSGAVSGS